jgi:hypothetical protein
MHSFLYEKASIGTNGEDVFNRKKYIKTIMAL